MKAKCVLFIVFLFLVHSALADRVLDQTEVLQIIQQLTQNPQNRWIDAGTITATHEEYKPSVTLDQDEIKLRIANEVKAYAAKTDKMEVGEDIQKMKLDATPFNVAYKLSNESTMICDEIVKFDSGKFYWEINVKSRTDSVKPNKDLADNYMTDQFDLRCNAKRIFAWNGNEYINYVLPINHAMINPTSVAPRVNGPINAGIIPWGHGVYTYENLAASQLSAVEKIEEGKTVIELTINHTSGAQMVFTLDPQKNYVVTASSISPTGSNAKLNNRYANFSLVAGRWVPMTIFMERYEKITNKLLARDVWEITSVNTAVPAITEFSVNYEENAYMEYFASYDGKAEGCHKSQTADIEAILAERLAYKLAPETQKQNCATATLGYIAPKLGKTVTPEQMAQLVDENDGETSLYQMKQFLQNLGLYCRAVKTDIDALKTLDNCQKILYIPGKKHFVILDSVDNEYVWTIDLANSKFYYHTDIFYFGMDWTDGVALLVSGQPVAGDFTEIANEELQQISGAAYTCNKIIQEYGVINCDPNICEGSLYREYYERWGCGVTPTGSCSSQSLIRFRQCNCYLDLNVFMCDEDSQWIFYYMRACQ